ncbi:alpha/beta hydrolase [Fictibacillus sp. Mic-4]|uniref:alpha/beta fold hydrolase n=1 Tax=Fictibacillus sp. Mic-4 TaxID=3132826 RepID=UPI003CF247E7
MDTKTLLLPNLEMAYVDEGEGKTIVLLHGFCGSHKYWTKQIEELAKDYRVIAPDLRGHGKSTITNETTTIESMADDIKWLLDKLNIEKVTMFGHSLGGYITLAFAEKYEEMLEGFALVHSTALPDSEEAKKGRMLNIERVKRNGIHSLVDHLIPKLFSAKNVEEKAKAVEVAKEIGYVTSPEGAIAALEAMKDRPDRNSLLENTSLPVLLVAGKEDSVIPLENAFSATKETIIQYTIEKAGHMSMYEEPDELIHVMRSFLRSH